MDLFGIKSFFINLAVLYQFTDGNFNDLRSSGCNATSHGNQKWCRYVHLPLRKRLRNAQFQQASGMYVCPEKVWTRSDSSCYLPVVYSDPLHMDRSWTSARQGCRDRGGDLVALDTPGEGAFLGTLRKNANIDSSCYVWIGLSDVKKEGQFEWVNGKSLKPEEANWQNGEPDSFNPTNPLANSEDYVISSEVWKWSDVRNDWNDTINGRPEPTGYVCETAAVFQIPRGVPGQRGAAGDPGRQGDPGVQGPDGKAGPQGPQGDKGPKGTVGDRGPSGVLGPPGDPGQDGESGRPGETGPQGAQGVPGTNGLPGEQGAMGEKGLLGDTGPQGPQGVVGPQGTPGEKGGRGFNGFKGNKGEKGERGVTGLRGDDGSKGILGDPGIRGLPGLDGSSGAKGLQGDIGPQGLLGQPGPKGEKGDLGDMGPRGFNGFKGQKGDNGDDGAKGLMGDEGPRGPHGNRGSPGDDGVKGLQGDPGTTGDPGPTGPRGDKGEKGSNGNKGLFGDPGTAGPRGGKGFMGDRGFKGFQGDKGLSGSDGRSGNHGLPGPPGPPGPDITMRNLINPRNRNPSIPYINVTAFCAGLPIGLYQHPLHCWQFVKCGRTRDRELSCLEGRRFHEETRACLPDSQCYYGVPAKRSYNLSSAAKAFKLNAASQVSEADVRKLRHSFSVYTGMTVCLMIVVVIVIVLVVRLYTRRTPQTSQLSCSSGSDSSLGHTSLAKLQRHI